MLVASIIVAFAAGAFVAGVLQRLVDVDSRV